MRITCFNNILRILFVPVFTYIFIELQRNLVRQFFVTVTVREATDIRLGRYSAFL